MDNFFCSMSEIVLTFRSPVKAATDVNSGLMDCQRGGAKGGHIGEWPWSVMLSSSRQFPRRIGRQSVLDVSFLRGFMAAPALVQAIAFAIHLQDVCLMGQPIRQGVTGLYCSHRFVFRGRRGELPKLIWWDNPAACLFSGLPEGIG